MPAMSQRAYARHRGVNLSAVQRAIDSGRITVDPNGQIDPATADQQWASNTRTQALPFSRRGGQQFDDADAFGFSQYNKARAVREHYLARLARIEYEERAGNLVSRDEVKSSTFTLFRTFRDSLLNVPDRLSATLAAESDAVKVHDVLSMGIRKALNDFGDSILDKRS